MTSIFEQTDKKEPQQLWTRGFVLVCILNFLNFSGMWMLPAMLPMFIRDLGAPDFMLGWIAGLTSIATIITRPLAGLAVSRFGRRGVFVVGTVGMIITCIAFMLFPILGAVLAVRFIQGLAWGFTNTACTTIASDTIVKSRYGEGMGYFALASSIAMIISPALSLGVFQIWGGQIASLVCAVFFVLSLLCSCLVTYTKLPLHSKSITAPRRSLGTFIADTLFERAALSAAALMMLTACSYGLVQSFLPAMIEERGLGGMGTFFIVMALAAVVARPVFGRWADARNYYEPGVSAFIAMAISMLLMIWAHNQVLLYVAALFQGIGYSAGFSLFLALATVKTNPERRGTAIATVMVGFDVGAGVSAVALGLVLTIAGYEAVFVTGTVLELLGLALTVCFKKVVSAR